ncbi:DNA polymerase IV [Halalkalibacterium halodurans]|uniref:DNA polymerase IV n=1 Tax=Halalkalibacterium halodurans TaxID=86665 RepID=UPI002E220B64|nr:DNA polymerase IV [Halalkalibacterium halodurans]MED4082884.1 DNA polymerase IV [Halalkalibacterium halodurans]MED4084770.1 DNA polymerase IV [Halalkalibacterium halodurans]MED4106122.1 DNA polymerase IV [Halalkalibacterium halodurans]MED4110685.1 DNA polymerase IV [Halalkalibacterium halodurans]MED4126077.1 DNA polymerase IV [Halalkalibacterium halodurans]
MGKGRVIFHVDMNSFYASVEMAYDPSLKGKAIAVAGSVKDRRGIVVTSSYEARAKGVRSPIPVWQALRKCPELILIPPNFDRYRSASQKIFSLLEEYTPLVEKVSIDEGYMDVTTTIKKVHPLELAKEIQQRILAEMDLPCSIGIAPNKFLAKMASDMKKPLGITVLRKRDIAEKLWSLPIEEMYGIGRRSVDTYKKYQLHTIGDLAKADPAWLEKKFGINGPRLHCRANGIDERPVDPEAVFHFKSVGNSTTLPEDTTNEGRLTDVLHQLSHSVHVRMKRKHVFCYGVQLTIRYDDRKTITRSRKLEHPIQEKDDIFTVALSLWKQAWNGRPIRLLGVTGYDVIDKKYAYEPLDLFRYEEQIKQATLAETISSIHKRYGKPIVAKGKELDLFKEVDETKKGTSFDRDFFQHD